MRAMKGWRSLQYQESSLRTRRPKHLKHHRRSSGHHRRLQPRLGRRWGPRRQPHPKSTCKTSHSPWAATTTAAAARLLAMPRQILLSKKSSGRLQTNLARTKCRLHPSQSPSSPTEARAQRPTRGKRNVGGTRTTRTKTTTTQAVLATKTRPELDRTKRQPQLRPLPIMQCLVLHRSRKFRLVSHPFPPATRFEQPGSLQALKTPGWRHRGRTSSSKTTTLIREHLRGGWTPAPLLRVSSLTSLERGKCSARSIKMSR